jgi:ACS family hexuronate transporter-like MFS transporter
VIAEKEVSSQPDLRQSPGFPWQWAPIAVFVLFDALRMIDRQLLAALAPTIKHEFHISNAQYGGLVSVFSAVSMAAAPLAGLFIDRVGLNLGASVSIAFWSVAGMATGWTRALQGLIACRFGLGLGESGGMSAPGATLATYMNPAELGIGGAALSIGTSLGSLAAPLLVAALVPRYGWRFVFQACGALGLLWVPIWLLTTKLVPARFKAVRQERTPFRELLRDRRFWGIVAVYALAKQTLWVNWTTIYFVQDRHLTMIEANRRYSWFPSAFAILAAITAGVLAMRWVRQGMGGVAARKRACWFIAPLALVTAAVPFAPTASLAALAIGISYFSSAFIWSSAHLMPIDLYGVGRAAFTYSILECALMLLQTVVSPLVGSMVDHHGFKLLCILMAIPPILGLAVLEVCFRTRETGTRGTQLKPALAPA